MPDPESSAPSNSGSQSSTGGSSTGGSRPGTQSTSPAHEVELPYPEELQAMLAGAYEVESFLGQGGMGAVYRGLQMPLRRPVAIKILAKGVGDDYGFAERFKREAYAMAALTHPNIVQVYDCGDAGENFLFISMELVEGGDLSDALKSNQITPEVALNLMPQICDGLQAAHERGIVHRDIKPANIFLTADGRPKVADFGLAKKFDGGGTMLTKTGLGLGTPDYAAPEQYENLPDIDHRADIYSMGVMFYQLLTGRLPRGSWKAPSTRAAIDPRLDDVVLGAMAADRADRYQTVADFKAGILAVTSQPARTASVPAQAPVSTRTAAVPLPTAAMRTGAVPTRTSAVPMRPTGAVPGRPTGAVPAARQTGAVPSRTQAVPVHRAAVSAPAQQGGGPRTGLIATVVCLVVAVGAWMFMKLGGGGGGDTGAGTGAGTGMVVELLDAANPKGTPVRGIWTGVTSGLNGRTVPFEPGLKDTDRMPIFELPYTPPEEYDFEVEFTRSGGSVVQVFTAGGKSAVHELRPGPDNGTPTKSGFYQIDGVGWDQATEGVALVPPPPRDGSRHVALVQVRRDSLRSFLNGREVVRWSGDCSRLGNLAVFSLTDDSRLGIGSWGGDVTFHRATVREISGPGQHAAATGTLATVTGGSGSGGAALSSEKARAVAEWVFSQNGFIIVGSEGINRKVSQIGEMPPGSVELVELDLPGSRPLTTVPPLVLSALAEAKSMKRLAPRNCALGSRELATILADKPDLTNLNLNGCQPDDDVFDVLSRLPALDAVDLSWCRKITGRGLERLAPLASLNHINLSTTGLTDAGLAGVGSVKSLRSLHISENQITDAGLPPLSALVNLDVLQIRRTSVTVAGMQAMRGASKLRRVELSMGYGINEMKDLAGLAAVFPNFKELLIEFSGPKEGEYVRQLANLGELSALHGLMRLDLRSSNNVSASLISGLDRLTNLEYLGIWQSFSDDEVPLLKPLRSLKTLRLINGSLTPHGALALVPLPSLQDINRGSFTDEGLTAFKGYRPEVRISN